MKRRNIIFNIFTTILASVLIGFSCFAVLVLSYTMVIENIGKNESIFFRGYKPVVIISESMEPTMKVNGVSIMKRETDIDGIKNEDIIMFKTDTHGLVMHRVIGRDECGLITQGDNNPYPDNWRVTNENLKGKVIDTYNIVADFITFLFGDLVNINAKHLIFGFGVLTAILVALIVAINTCYENIKTMLELLIYQNRALIKESKYDEHKLKQDEIQELVDMDNYKANIIDKLILKYYVFQLRDIFKKDEENADKSRKIYKKAFKVMLRVKNKANKK